MTRSSPILVLCVGAFLLGSAALAFDPALGPWNGPCAQSGGLAPGCGGGQPVRRGPPPPPPPSPEEIAQSRAQSLYRDGQDAAKRGDNATALQLLEEARAVWPDLRNIDNDINNIQADIERTRSNARFGSGVDSIHQSLGNQMDAAKNAGNADDPPLMSADGPTPQPAANGRHYIASGNAFIGGMTWITGFYVAPGSAPDLAAKEQEILRRLADAEGIPYNSKIDFSKYNFVVALAVSTDGFSDLANRVVFDEFRSGQFTAEEQKAYNSMKGRRFQELACHSNGAMICLAALENKDIQAKNIVLFGPQITPESLYMWDVLLRTGKISTLRIFLNQGDPVPATAMLASNPTGFMSAVAIPALAAPLYNADVLARVIKTFAPSASVRTFGCGKVADIACHDAKVYTQETRICPASSGKIVPGTTIHGRGGVVEPPPPC